MFCLAAIVLAAGLACAQGSVSLAPPPAPTAAPPGPPVVTAPVHAAEARTCFCFNWVHLDQFGYECFETAAACDEAHAKSGFGDRTGCAINTEHEQCVKVGCAQGKCYRYGDCSGTASCK